MKDDESRFTFIQQSLTQMCEQFVREVRERGLGEHQHSMARFMLDVFNGRNPDEKLDVNLFEVRIDCGPSKFAGVSAFVKHEQRLKEAEIATFASDHRADLYEKLLRKHGIDPSTGRKVGDSGLWLKCETCGGSGTREPNKEPKR